MLRDGLSSECHVVLFKKHLMAIAGAAHEARRVLGQLDTRQLKLLRCRCWSAWCQKEIFAGWDMAYARCWRATIFESYLRRAIDREQPKPRTCGRQTVMRALPPRLPRTFRLPPRAPVHSITSTARASSEGARGRAPSWSSVYRDPSFGASQTLGQRHILRALADV